MQTERRGPAVSRIAFLALATLVVMLNVTVAMNAVISQCDGLIRFLIGA